jgi:hypothetical protein
MVEMKQNTKNNPVAGDVVQGVGHPLSKCTVLNSNPSTIKKKKKVKIQPKKRKKGIKKEKMSIKLKIKT